MSNTSSTLNITYLEKLCKQLYGRNSILEGENKGYICVAAANPWEQRFFKYPSQWDKAVEFWQERQAESKCVYFSVHTLKGKSKRKENAPDFISAAWVDLDAGAVEDLKPAPSICYRTSEGKYQAIWLLVEPAPADKVEGLNRKLAYSIPGADRGAWNLGRVLRVPGSINFKYGSPQQGELLWDDGPEYNVEQLEQVVPLLTEKPGAEKGSPAGEDGKEVQRVLDFLATSPGPEDDRSVKLSWVYRTLYENGWPVRAIVMAVRNSEWGKKYPGEKLREDIERVLGKPGNSSGLEVNFKKKEEVSEKDGELKPFPEEAAVGICAEIAHLFSDRLEAPFVFWYISALTCLGAAISGCVTLDTELAPQPRLYSVIMGRTASPRKSTAMGKISRFYKEALSPLDTVHFEHGLGSAEGLAEALQRKDGGLSRCLILLDELRLLVQKARIEHSALLPMLTTLYHNNDFSNTTRRTKIRLDKAHFSLLSACTEDTFADMWTPEFIQIGFINRLFLIPGDSEKSIAMPESIPQEKWDECLERLYELVKQATQVTTATFRITGELTITEMVGHKLKLTPEALQLWERWYANRPTGIHADRLDDLGLRLMILSEVSQGNLKTVELETVENVIKILSWQYEVRRLFDPIDAESKMARVEEKIRRNLHSRGTCSERDLKRYTNAHREGLWVFNQALGNLKSAGEVKSFSKGKKKLYGLVG